MTSDFFTRPQDVPDDWAQPLLAVGDAIAAAGALRDLLEAARLLLEERARQAAQEAQEGPQGPPLPAVLSGWGLPAAYPAPCGAVGPTSPHGGAQCRQRVLRSPGGLETPRIPAGRQPRHCCGYLPPDLPPGAAEVRRQLLLLRLRDLRDLSRNGVPPPGTLTGTPAAAAPAPRPAPLSATPAILKPTCYF